MLADFFALSPWVQVTACVCLALVLMTVAVQWRKMRQRETDQKFTRELLERGLTIEEIERLLRSSMAPRRGLLKQFAGLHWGTKAGLIFLAFMLSGMIFGAVNSYIFWVARK